MDDDAHDDLRSNFPRHFLDELRCNMSSSGWQSPGHLGGTAMVS